MKNLIPKWNERTKMNVFNLHACCFFFQLFQRISTAFLYPQRRLKAHILIFRFFLSFYVTWQQWQGVVRELKDEEEGIHFTRIFLCRTNSLMAHHFFFKKHETGATLLLFIHFFLSEFYSFQVFEVFFVASAKNINIKRTWKIFLLLHVDAWWSFKLKSLETKQRKVLFLPL